MSDKLIIDYEKLVTLLVASFISLPNLSISIPIDAKSLKNDLTDKTKFLSFVVSLDTYVNSFNSQLNNNKMNVVTLLKYVKHVIQNNAMIISTSNIDKFVFYKKKPIANKKK